MAKPRARSANRRPDGDSALQQAAIAWVLALEGDINENHKGGNATLTLTTRLAARGVTFLDRDVYNRMYFMEKKSQISRLTEKQRTYAIRLTVPPEEVGPNPFEDQLPTTAVPEPVQAIVVNGNGNSSLPMDDIVQRVMAFPARRKIDLAMELLRSVNQDLDRV